MPRHVRHKDSNMREAMKLAAQGYAITSRAFCMATRIERPDWRENMAIRHAPWSLSEGLKWVSLLGGRAGDHYRRVYSKDKVTVHEDVRKYMPRSSSCDLNDYLPKKGEMNCLSSTESTKP